MRLFGSVEAGGTKFVCAVAAGPDDIRSEITIPTQTPTETLCQVVAYFRDFQEINKEPIEAVGVASFGPLDLQRTSKTYGYITTTPKEGWAYTNVVGYIENELKVPVGFDTDVNGAALAEAMWGAGKGLEVVLYLTVGTGIGGGLYVYGRPLHGLVHPEMGHVIVSRDREKDDFKGCCPYHQDCLEGLASGRSVDLRWQCHASELADDHPAWELEADYLAQGLVDFIVTLSPEKIVLGGGLMQKNHLFALIHQKVTDKLGGYVSSPVILEDIENYIVSPGLGNRSGICGGLALAMDAAGSR